MKILNCRITKSDSSILTDYNLTDRNMPICTGINISTSGAVYSICPGKIVFIGTSDSYNISQDKIRIVVQYDLGHLFGYDVAVALVSLGDSVDYQTKLGTCSKGVLHFEYYNLFKTTIPMRINGTVYYKQNPLEILIDGYESIYNYSSGVSASDNSTWVTDYIFTDNELKHLTR